MGYELVASGGILDAAQFSQYESCLEEGQRGLVELDLRLPVSQSLAAELENKLKQAGVEEVRVSTASPMLRIYFRKGLPWLAIIAAAILGMIVLAIMIVGWRLFKDMAEVIPPVPLSIMMILAIGLAIVLVARKG